MLAGALYIMAWESLWLLPGELAVLCVILPRVEHLHFVATLR